MKINISNKLDTVPANEEGVEYPEVISYHVDGDNVWIRTNRGSAEMYLEEIMYDMNIDDFGTISVSKTHEGFEISLNDNVKKYDVYFDGVQVYARINNKYISITNEIEQ